jgi:hypothetical protein
MAEWVRVADGTALKTTDAMLDRIGELYAENALLREELRLAMECALVR